MGGVVVLSFFAAAWGVAGLAMMGTERLWFALPIAISVALVLTARSMARRFPSQLRHDQRKIDRLVAIWSSVEGVAIFLAVNLVASLHHSEWNMAVICGIVGLHFIPLAQGFPYPPYYWTALVMTGIAAMGMVYPHVVTPAVVGLTAAATLWVTTLFLLRRAYGWPAHARRSA